ncbi:MAG TPA: hypothetical protein VFR15_16105 [Chloroflexia bacterium]|nr:hypothetical protein [Chloroflexia bacterium]
MLSRFAAVDRLRWFHLVGLLIASLVTPPLLTGLLFALFASTMSDANGWVVVVVWVALASLGIALSAPVLIRFLRWQSHGDRIVFALASFVALAVLQILGPIVAIMALAEPH